MSLAEVAAAAAILHAWKMMIARGYCLPGCIVRSYLLATEKGGKLRRWDILQNEYVLVCIHLFSKPRVEIKVARLRGKAFASKGEFGVHTLYVHERICIRGFF